MSVKDIEGSQSRQIEMLRKKMRQEVNHLEETHGKNISKLNDEHNAELSTIKDRNRRIVQEEVEKKEQVLNRMRNQLESTQKMNSESLKKLKESGTQTIKNERIRLSAESESVKANHDTYLEDLNGRYQDKMQEIKHKGNQEVHKLNYENNRVFATKEGDFQKKFNEQHNSFHQKFNKVERENQKTKDNQDAEFKRNRITAVKNQQIEMDKITDGHLKSIKNRDIAFRESIKEQDEAFESRFNQTVQVQDSTFKNLEERYDKAINGLKNKLQASLANSIERSEDPFYQFQELRPQLTHHPDGVEIKIPVPEHAKKDMQLTLNGTIAIINFHRRYEDQKRNEDGSISKINKVEALVSKVPTDYKLDPKTVKSSYSNGLMTFEVKKV